MSSGLCYNLQVAQKAVDHVRRQLPRGSGNQNDSPSDGAACVTHVRDTMVSTADFIPHLARRASEVGCGNCGEQAAVACMYLLGLRVRSLDYMNLYSADGTAIRSFVVIDFTPEGDGNSSGWGSEAVVCDPWDCNHVYPAYQIGQKMALYRNGCTVRSKRRDA